MSDHLLKREKSAARRKRRLTVEDVAAMMVDGESDLTDESESLQESEEVNGNVSLAAEDEELENSAMLHETMRENKENRPLRGQSRKQREENKMRKEHGLEHTNRKGEKDGRKLQPTTCKDTCCDRISEAQREVIFDQFYELNTSEQDQFISGCMIEMGVKRRRTGSTENTKRNYSRKYFLTTGSGRHSVCRSFFLATLSISDSRIRTISRKRRESDTSITDQRGRHPSIRRISDEERQKVRDHIEKFPVYQSHYSRERTDKLFLSPELSVNRMYSMYVEEMCKNGEQAQKEWLYYEVFKEYSYLSFAKLKSDTCNKCDKYKAAGQSQSEQHTAHLNEAEAVYKQKRMDKKRCNDDDGFQMISYDLQKCLPTPNLSCSESFYKRQLWVYNLTIYDYKHGPPHCYMWSEDVAKRGGNEIASCLYDFIQTKLRLNPDIKEFKLYSDSCAGQNKNRQVLGMLKFLSETTSTKMTHTFMVPGHTHMECDSVHAIIEKAKKRMDIFVPNDWFNLVRMAKTSPPYLTVVPINQDKIYRWDKVSEEIMKLPKTGEFRFSSIRNYCIEIDDHDVLHYNYNMHDQYEGVTLTGRTTKDADAIILQPCYSRPLEISVKKKADLISLLPFIPAVYHSFYEGLNSSTSTEDQI